MQLEMTAYPNLTLSKKKLDWSQFQLYNPTLQIKVKS